MARFSFASITEAFDQDGFLKTEMPLLHQDTLKELRQLEDESPESQGFLNRLIEIYRANTPAIITHLEQAIAEKDGQQIRNLSHKLKGMGLNLGARRLAILCETIELFCDRLEDAPAKNVVSQLKQEHNLTLQTLEKHWTTPIKK